MKFNMRGKRNWNILFYIFCCLLVLFFGLEKVISITTTTWDFGTASDYIYNDSFLSITNSSSTLDLVDQVDDDNTTTGFAGGSHSDTQFDTDHIELDSTGLTNGTGTFTSRIIDSGTTTSWTTLQPINAAPYQKELPDSQAVETDYAEQNADMTNNLLLLHLDESSGNVIDTSGNGYTGTTSGTAYSRDGVYNTAIEFDGIDDNIIVADFDDTSGAETLTIEGWFKFTSVNASDVLVSQWNNGTDARFSWQTHTVSDELAFYVSQNAAGSTNEWWRTTDANLVADTWYHLALVWDGTAGTEVDKVKMYRNGTALTITQAGTAGATAFRSSSGLDLKIGDMENYDPRELPAVIDEIAIHSHAATVTEMLNHYKRGAFRAKYQVRTCDDDACSGESFVGPSGDTNAYYTELLSTTTSTPSYTLSGLSNNRYFQYSVLLQSSSTLYGPDVNSVSIGPAHYYGGSPTTTITTSTALNVGSSVTSFSTTESGEGKIYYQVSNNAASTTPTWYYWDGGAWAQATTNLHYNTSSTINTNISTFSATGTFGWRAFSMSQNATEQAKLSQIQSVHQEPVLASSADPDIFTTSNLIIDSGYYSATGTFKSIVDWKVDGSSVAVLNMPMEQNYDDASSVVDYSDSGNNGTVYNAVASSTAGFDGEGAYDFDGSGDYISVAHDASLALTNNFTVTAWVRKDTTAAYDGFVGKMAWNDGSPNGWSINYDSVKSRYSVTVGCDGTISTIASDIGTTNSVDYGWHHVGMQVSSSTVSFFIDGTLQEQTTTQTICESGDALTIGRYYADSSGHYIDGVVDEVVVWNKVLTASQISTLYDGSHDRIVAGQAAVGEAWSAEIVQNNGVYDASSETSNALTIVARSDTTPVISSHNQARNNNWIASTGSITLNIWDCVDEDGDSLTYSWTVDGVAAASTQSFTFSGADYSASQHTVIGYCTDDDSNSDSVTLTIEIIDSDEFVFMVPNNASTHSANYGYIGEEQTQWIVDQQSNMNIQFVTYAGDSVIDGSRTADWSTLQTNLSLLDTANIPYALSIGNHDYDDNLIPDNSGTRAATNLETYFPLANYSSETWWGGQKGSTNVNTYQYLTIFGIDYMFVQLEFCPSDDSIAWANTLISDNSTRNVILVTHAYLNHDNNLLLMDDYLGCGDFFDPSFENGTDKNDGQQIWDELVKLHDNIVLVHSSHVLGDGHAYRSDLGNNNNLIHQAFHYSYAAYNGDAETNAYVAIYIFKPNDNIVQVRKYDPHFDNFKTSNGHEYSFGFSSTSTPSDFAESQKNQTSLTFSWDANGNSTNNQYYIENTTNGVNSGWISGTSYTMNSLQCAVPYVLSIKSRNSFQYETPSVELSTRTDVCGFYNIPLDSSNTTELPDLVEIEENIEAEEDSSEISSDECALDAGKAYKHNKSKGVWYITNNCTKRVFNSGEKFFSYFKSWADVKKVHKIDLDSIETDKK